MTHSPDEIAKMYEDMAGYQLAINLLKRQVKKLKSEIKRREVESL